MFLLGEPIQFDDFSAFHLSSTSHSTIVKRFIWYNLAPRAWKRYKAVITFYKNFCILMKLAPWSATHITLKKQSAHQIFQTNLPNKGLVKPDTLISYFSGLDSYHIDYYLSVQVFDDLCLTWIIKSGKTLFPSVKSTYFPITKNSFEKIISQLTRSLKNLHIDAEFKIVQAGYLCLHEITYTTSKFKKKCIFVETDAIKSDVLFFEKD